MTWCEKKDVMMLRVLVTEEVFSYKFRSRERGKAWQEVADQLNLNPGFAVTARSVRDRYTILAKKLKQKNAKEKKESGGGGDAPPSEMEILLQDLAEITEATDKREEEKTDKKREKSEQEKNNGQEMRDRALERFGETRKRHAVDGDGEVVETKRRRSSSDTLEWLREKAIEDRKLKEKEQKHKREELDIIEKFIDDEWNSTVNFTRKTISHESRSDECDIVFSSEIQRGISRVISEFFLNLIPQNILQRGKHSLSRGCLTLTVETCRAEKPFRCCVKPIRRSDENQTKFSFTSCWRVYSLVMFKTKIV